MNSKPNLAAHHQILLIIWVSLLVSQLIFVLIVFLTKPELFSLDLSQPLLGQNGAMVLSLAAVAVICVVISFVLKRRSYERAVEEQDPMHVQSGLITALALCEASSLVGLFLAFAFDYQYFFLWLALGIVGMLLHFPRQNDLLAAGYK